jgi:hypothetical protein
MKAIPQEEWQWFGTPGHLCVARDCRFHLCTKVGPWLVSTVGEWIPPERDRDEAWLEENWPGQEVDDAALDAEDVIGFGRKYETYVFKAGKPCASAKCGRCGLPAQGGPELDSMPANTTGDANRNHLAMCKKWAGRP